MRTETRYVVQFERDGLWWLAGSGPTPERARQAYWNKAGLQPRDDNFTDLPRRLIKITTQTTRVQIDWNTEDEERTEGT